MQWAFYKQDTEQNMFLAEIILTGIKVNDRQVILGNYRYIGVSLIFAIRYWYIVDMPYLESMTALYNMIDY
jgi:hypothetical protein